jgi:hypothetical protein
MVLGVCIIHRPVRNIAPYLWCIEEGTQMKGNDDASCLSLEYACLVSDWDDEFEEPTDYEPRLLPYLYHQRHSYKLLPYEVAKYELFARVQKGPISQNPTTDMDATSGEELTRRTEPLDESVSLATFYRAAAASPAALELASEHLGDTGVVGLTLRQIEAGGFRLMQRSYDESGD